MKKLRIFVVFLLLVALAWPGPQIFAAPPIELFLDGELLGSDVAPVIVNGRTLVPLRVIMESLGATVVWVSNSEPIRISRDHIQIRVQVGKTQASVDDEAITLDVAPTIVQNRAMVPLRFIAESLGAGVLWQDTTRSVHITSPGGELSPGELLLGQGVVTGLSFASTRAMKAGNWEFTEDGKQATLLLQDVVVEPEFVAVNSGDLESFQVEPTGRNGARISLNFGNRGTYLAPRAVLSVDGKELNIAWSLTLKKVFFVKEAGVERLVFLLPEANKPVVSDAPVEVKTKSSLPGRINVSQGANVRANPSTESERIDLLANNTAVKVIGVTSGWYEVEMSGNKTGWIADWLVAVETEVETTVGVNVRKTPSTADSSNILTTIYPGHKIRVLERLEGWCRVDYGSGREGYIADYLVPLESRLIDVDTRPGLAVRFPGVAKGDQLEMSLGNSNHLIASRWEEDADGITLFLEQRQEAGYSLDSDERGWALRFGTWVEGVSFTSTARGPRVRLKLDGPGQPVLQYSPAVKAIVVTIPGSTLASGIPTSLPGDGSYVSQVKIEQAGADVRLMLQVPELPSYNLQKIDEFTWDVRLASPTLVGKLVAIDPGHGHTDSGAVGTLGWHEANYTHDIAYRLRDLLLEAGVEVMLTRTFESGRIEGPARAAKINEAGADLFISIHINSASNKDARGIETWYHPRGDNERFARMVQTNVLAALGGDWPNRGVKSGRYIICVQTMTTGAMAELGFISNRTDENALYQAQTRQLMAEGLFRAIEEYFSR